jgi:hypothetical protein
MLWHDMSVLGFAKMILRYLQEWNMKNLKCHTNTRLRNNFMQQIEFETAQE